MYLFTLFVGLIEGKIEILKSRSWQKNKNETKNKRYFHGEHPDEDVGRDSVCVRKSRFCVRPKTSSQGYGQNYSQNTHYLNFVQFSRHFSDDDKERFYSLRLSNGLSGFFCLFFFLHQKKILRK